MYGIFICLCLGFAQLHASLVSKPPHSSRYIPSNLKYDHITSANGEYVDQILKKVRLFSSASYEIHSVNGLGMFFLDQKSDWIKDLLKKGQPWEGYLAPIIRKYVKPNTVVLDVGAHIGTHTLNLSRAVGPGGMVIAFEPQTKTFCELFMNMELNRASNVWCFWGGLADKIDEIKLPKFHPEVEVAPLYDYTYEMSEEITPIITLDSLNLSNVSFLKVDVDGCDDLFLDGARETILRNKPVMVMEILGGADIDTAIPEHKKRILNTQKKITDLGYGLERISVHDYLCLPIQ